MSVSPGLRGVCYTGLGRGWVVGRCSGGQGGGLG